MSIEALVTVQKSFYCTIIAVHIAPYLRGLITKPYIVAHPVVQNPHTSKVYIEDSSTMVW
jgi:hypothetical protein